jgi:acetyl-CoA carboxylase biotin carboxyl carrier protein
MSSTLDDLRAQARHLASELPGSLRSMRISSGETTIEIEWQSYSVEAPVVQAIPVPRPVAEPQEQPTTVDDGSTMVSSPMVGTFYRSSSPDAAPFVEVGDTVTEGQTVAIVEAMKLFNPITAECAGTVVEVLATDGQAVEFGQPLLRVAPSGQE